MGPECERIQIPPRSYAVARFGVVWLATPTAGVGWQLARPDGLRVMGRVVDHRVCEPVVRAIKASVTPSTSPRVASTVVALTQPVR